MANGYVNFSDFFDMNAESAAADAVAQEQSAAEQQAADEAKVQALQAQYETDRRGGSTKNLTDYSAFLELQAEAKMRDARGLADRNGQRSPWDAARGAPAQPRTTLQDQLGRARIGAASFDNKQNQYRQAQEAQQQAEVQRYRARQSEQEAERAKQEEQRQKLIRAGRVKTKWDKYYAERKATQLDQSLAKRDQIYGEFLGSLGQSPEDLATVTEYDPRKGY